MNAKEIKGLWSIHSDQLFQYPNKEKLQENGVSLVATQINIKDNFLGPEKELTHIFQLCADFALWWMKDSESSMNSIKNTQSQSHN